jgi:xanthine dehydrogenase accessory factor
MIRADLWKRSQTLLAERVPFVVATVVRAKHPTSVRAGDTAIVFGDGRIEGFVGGVCAESSVRLHALRVLETGDALLLRLLPEGDLEDEPHAAEGAVTVRNECLSGGGLEIFLEPHLPSPTLAVHGDTPVADALVSLAEQLGFAVLRGDHEDAAHADAVLVATHGRAEEDVLARALREGAPYVGLVASRRRGDAVRAALDVPDELCGHLHSPAGLDIGGRTPQEIALSILAEIVKEARAAAPRGATAPTTDASHSAPGLALSTGGAPAARPPVRSAIDPICGMEVAITPSTISFEHDGRTEYFCCEGCRDRFAAEHARV